MYIKADKRTWIEVPDDATEEFKQEKIAKHLKEEKNRLEKLKVTGVFNNQCSNNKVGALYDKRINLTELKANFR